MESSFMLLCRRLDLHESRRHCNGSFEIDLNRCGIKNPAFYGRGSVFNSVLLGYFFVREMVPSKIGECLGEEDRG
jgi:hypothetical protein